MSSSLRSPQSSTPLQWDCSGTQAPLWQKNEPIRFTTLETSNKANPLDKHFVRKQKTTTNCTRPIASLAVRIVRQMRPGLKKRLKFFEFKSLLCSCPCWDRVGRATKSQHNGMFVCRHSTGKCHCLTLVRSSCEAVQSNVRIQRCH